MSNLLRPSGSNNAQIDLMIQELYEDCYLLNQHFGGFGNMSSLPLIRTLASPILRRWICDRNFSIIPRFCKQPIRFNVHHSQQAVKLCKAGVAKRWIEMMPTMGVSIGHFQSSDNRTNPYDQVTAIRVPFDYKAFCIQKLVFYKGRFYTRTDFVNFVANKLGGTHLRKPSFGKHQEIFEASNQLGFGVKEGKVLIVAEEDMSDRRKVEETNKCTVYDLSFLATLDTSRIFAETVLRDVFACPSEE
jgi:hypothetical protein